MAINKELVGRQPNSYFPVFWVCTQLCYYYDCVFVFKLVFVPSKAFRMMRDNSWFDSVKKQKLLCSVQKNLKITGTCFSSECFTHDWYTNFPRCNFFSEFLEVQRYGHYSNFYRLFCFRQILFSLHSLLVLMNLWIISGGVSHGEVGMQ
jgi:hypothetical protein